MVRKYLSECPTQAALQVLGGKWKMCLLYHLTFGPQRYSELRRLADGITEKMLSQQLRELEEDGLVTRTVYPAVPPHVEYTLTALGAQLGTVFQPITAWGRTLLDQLEAGRVAATPAQVC